MSVFRGKLVCLYCQKGMKFKRERNKGKYICSIYDTVGKCQRTIVEVDTLIELIERRYKCKFSEGELRSLVEKIEVKGKYEFIIHFYNDDPIVSMDGQFIF